MTYVYFPAQILQSLIQSIENNQFRTADLNNGLGYRTTKDHLDDNPNLVVGAYRKTFNYAGNPGMSDTQWAARAFESRAMDPSLGQSMAFPTAAKMLLRIEVPLWPDVKVAKHPTRGLYKCFRGRIKHHRHKRAISKICRTSA